MNVLPTAKCFPLQVALLQVFLKFEVFFEASDLLFLLASSRIHWFRSLPDFLQAGTVEAKLANDHGFKAAVHAEFFIVEVDLFLLVGLDDLRQLVEEQILLGLMLSSGIVALGREVGHGVGRGELLHINSWLYCLVWMLFTFF